MQNRYHSRTRSISVALISDQIVEPGHNFTLTASFEGLNASSYDALVIPGGRAPEYLALDESVIKLVKEFMEVGKPVASICHGQQILSAAGALKGKKCTAYPAVKLNVVLGGATWLEPDPISRICSCAEVSTTIPLCLVGIEIPQVYYSFNPIFMLAEPLMLASVFFFFFMACVAYLHVDLSIRK
ncbi:hypothetical protein CsSME_00050185 [Camellia sinensis var. sinensis]